MGSDRVFRILAQETPSGLQFASVVMIASRARKLAMSMRNACPGLAQHALGDANYVGCGNVPHAAMVVHGADRTVAGLARHDSLGLNRRCEAVQRRPVIGAGGAEKGHGGAPQ